MVRAWRVGVWASFRWFVSFLAVDTILPIASLVFTTRSNKYAWSYLGILPLLWILYILIMLELYGLVLKDYAGISSISRKVTTAAMAIAVLVSAASLSLDMNVAAHRFPILHYYTVIHRGLISSLLIFQLLITLFLVWFPVRLEPNVLRHAVIYFFYFLISALALFYGNITGSEATPLMNVGLMACSVCCLVAWTVAFQRPGEARSAVLRPGVSKEEEERLLAQLRAINESLLRATRK